MHLPWQSTSYLRLNFRHEKLSRLLLWRTFLAPHLTSLTLLPDHPNLKWGETISRSAVLSSQEPCSSTTSPGSLWLISHMTTERFLATPNYTQGWQVCLVTFCQYHLMHHFHPALLPAKNQNSTNHPAFWLGFWNSTSKISQYLKFNPEP